MSDHLDESALEYHRFPSAGKISVVPTKSMTSQRDLALAYSPGVAVPCLAIAANPDEARNFTSRGNLVAVVSNGTAVLGLGNIGALASKPVMEGKGCLFKKFADIDVFDIEIDESDPDRIVDIVAALEPTFGGINLEDIKAPECFYIETKLRERMKIPVFHDDQHGTAIVAGAAVINGLEIVGKKIEDIKIVASGAGAAAIACLDLLVGLGAQRKNIYVSDSRGVVFAGRTDYMDDQKAQYAQPTDARTLDEIIADADLFLGLSAGGVLKPDMVLKMADRPLILALANPDPEILPEVAKAARRDAIVATGRSDYPNQVNNVLCFPFIFRGALDVGATTINEEMKFAAVRAIATLARAEQSDVVASAYGHGETRFGPDFLIPRPFDPRLISVVAPAVAEAATRSGVATRPIKDMEAYRRAMERFVYKSGNIMKPVFEAATQSVQRVIYAEGEDARVLRAAQIAVDERLARPVLVGRKEAIARKVREFGLRLEVGRDFDLIDPQDEALVAAAADKHYQLTRRRGGARDRIHAAMRANNTLLAATMLRLGKADSMLCGTEGDYHEHLGCVSKAIGLGEGRQIFAAMNMLMLPQHTIFICDTYVNADPTAQEIADITVLATEEMRRFGLTPRVALLSHSSFGSSEEASARKMRAAADLALAAAPDIEIEGEMRGDTALSKKLLDATFPDSRLSGEANLLIMPNLDAANITYNVLKTISGDGVTVGPILLGAALPVHILTPASTVRGILNMTALAAVDASIKAGTRN